MNIKISALGLLLAVNYATAGAPVAPASSSDSDDTVIDSALLESLVSASEMVILGDLKAISSIRRVADRVAPGPWILTQYFVEVEDVILSSRNSAPETVSFVSYGGDLVLESPWLEKTEADPLKSGGYEMIFNRFGGSESLSHSPRITQTGKYLIFIQTTRQRHLFEGFRLAGAYGVEEVDGSSVVKAVSRSWTKTIEIGYDDFISEIQALSESLDTFEPDHDSRRKDLNLSDDEKSSTTSVPLLKLLGRAAIDMFGPVVTEFVVSENPCFIEIDSDICAATISWTATGGSRTGDTLVSDSTGGIIGGGLNGSVAVELSPGSNVFDLLYRNAADHDRQLSSIDAVAAEISGDIFGFDQCEIESASDDKCHMNIHLLGFSEHAILYDLGNETSIFELDANGPFRTVLHLEVPIGGIKIGLFSDYVSEGNLLAKKTVTAFQAPTEQ